jgi:hypothetical protein
VLEASKPAGALRIWVAAASHGEDIYLPPDVVFPNVMGRKLQLQGVSAQVLNASRAGSAIESDLAFLKREFGWRPDAVVLYQLSLDIGLLSRRFLGPAKGKFAEGGAEEQPPAALASEPSWAGRLYRKTTTYELLNAVVTTRICDPRAMTSAPKPERRSSARWSALSTR